MLKPPRANSPSCSPNTPPRSPTAPSGRTSSQASRPTRATPPSPHQPAARSCSSSTSRSAPPSPTRPPPPTIRRKRLAIGRRARRRVCGSARRSSSANARPSTRKPAGAEGRPRARRASGSCAASSSTPCAITRRGTTTWRPISSAIRASPRLGYPTATSVGSSRSTCASYTTGASWRPKRRSRGMRLSSMRVSTTSPTPCWPIRPSSDSVLRRRASPICSRRGHRGVARSPGTTSSAVRPRRPHSC